MKHITLHKNVIMIITSIIFLCALSGCKKISLVSAKTIDFEATTDYWTDSDLLNTDVSYPGCTLGSVDVDGENYLAISRDGIILYDVPSTDGTDEEHTLVISKDNKNSQIQQVFGLGNYALNNPTGQRLIMIDLTGDGEDEIIWREEHVDMSSVDYANIWVLDGITLEEVDVSNELFHLLIAHATEVEDYNLVENSDGTKSITYLATMDDGSTFKGQISSFFGDAVGEIQMLSDTDEKYIFVENGHLYAGVRLHFLSDQSAVYLSGHAIVSEVVYDQNLKMLTVKDSYDCYNDFTACTWGVEKAF